MSLLGRNSFAWASTMFVTLAAPVTLVAVTPLSDTVRSAISFGARSVFGAPTKPVAREPTIEEEREHTLADFEENDTTRIQEFLEKSMNQPDGWPAALKEIQTQIYDEGKRMVPYFKEYWTQKEYDNLVGLYREGEDADEYVSNDEITEEQVQMFVRKKWVNQYSVTPKLEAKVAAIQKSRYLYSAWNKIGQGWQSMKELIRLRHALPYTQRAAFEAAVEKTIEAEETRFNLPENVKFDEVVAVLAAAKIINPVANGGNAENTYYDRFLRQRAKNGVAYYLFNSVIVDANGELKKFHELTERQLDGLIQWGMGDGVTTDWLKKWVHWDPAPLSTAINKPTTGIRAKYGAPDPITQYADLSDWLRYSLNRPSDTMNQPTDASTEGSTKVDNMIDFTLLRQEYSGSSAGDTSGENPEAGYLTTEFYYDSDHTGPMVRVRYDLTNMGTSQAPLHPKWQISVRESNSMQHSWGPWQSAAKTEETINEASKPEEWTNWRVGEWGTGHRIHINPATVPMPPSTEVTQSQP